jgi:hypothetical protein
VVVSADVFEAMMSEAIQVGDADTSSFDSVDIYPSEHLPPNSMIFISEGDPGFADPMAAAESLVQGAAPAAPSVTTPTVALGPFADIREVREQADGSFAAYNAAGEYLLDIDREGLGQLGELAVAIKTIKTYDGARMDMLKTRNKSKRAQFAVPFGVEIGPKWGHKGR